MLTAYDYSMARIVDAAGVDVILVGDSASNVMAGNETTLPITLDQMIYHGASVVKGVKRALVVVDMPFGSYQGNSKEALCSAIRIMKETAADAVKLEGGVEIVESIKRILSAGIPVMGHLGLTPQSIHKFRNLYRTGKRTSRSAKTHRRCSFIGRSRLLRNCVGKNTSNSCGTSFTRTFYSHDRNRSRERSRRASIGDPRYARHQ